MTAKNYFVPALFFLTAFLHQPLRADVKMPAIFGDHMVLQQDIILPVWGTADPGEKVTVTLGAKSATSETGTDGKWMVKIPAFEAIPEPLTMTVTGKNTLAFSDVLVGEVWICSGQSNMEFPVFSVHNAGDETPKATDPQIRFFKIPHIAKISPQGNLTGKWEICSPATAKGFAAVAYFFGRDLRANLSRPVGLIQSAWSGTPAQSWTPIEGLQKDPELKEYVDIKQTLVDAYPTAIESYPGLLAAYEAENALWQKEVAPSYNPLLDAWKKESALAKAAGQPVPPMPQPEKPKPRAPSDPDGTGSTPTALYNGMIAPLIPYAIKGVIWYQGESNAGKPEQYRVLFSRMIREWRGNWGQGDFAFLFVQLAGYAKDEDWPFLREAQKQTLALPATGMATAIDIGDFADIHPKDKMDVGMRLALAARHVAYGQTLVYSGPVYESMKVEGAAIRINFSQTGGGLLIGTAPWHPPTAEALPADKLLGFFIAGEDKKWIEAEARIEGASVVVSSPAVPVPVAVRYAWSPFPKANLYNVENLPAFPFRTDDWPRPLPPSVPAK